MKETVQIVIPAGATERTEYDLVELTEYIANNVPETTNCGGGLGGEFGYGIEYENDTFMMHPFCWCEKEDECLWCMMNDPKSNKNYKKMKAELTEKYGKHWAKWGSAPNFFYKPTKTGCVWYKWIGRDTEWDKEPTKKEWTKIYKDCIKSLSLKKK